MRSWIRKPLGAVVIAGAVFAGAGAIIYPIATPTPPSGLANLWIGPTAGNGPCTRSASLIAYSSATECDDPVEAYAAASAGDLILWKAGTYALTNTSTQEINDRPGLGSADVVIQAAPGETVNVTGFITVKSHDLVIHGGDTLGVNEPDRIIVTRATLAQTDATFGNQGSGNPSGNVMEDVKGDSAWFTGAGSTFRYSELGPLDACNGTIGTPHDGVVDMVSSLLVDAVVFEGNYMHGLTKAACPGDDEHADMMDIQFAGQSRILNNIFEGCQDQCIFDASDTQAQADAMHGLKIEGNSFLNSDAIGVQCDGACEVNYNTFSGLALGAYRAGPAKPTSMTMTGNLFLQDTPCANTNGTVPGSTVTQSYSVFPTAQASACGTGSTKADATRSDNFGHITSGTYSAIIGKGNPTYCPAIDLDGDTRPAGASSTCDAGADEVP